MSLHLKVGSDFIHHLEGLIKSVFHGLADQAGHEVKGALDNIKGHAEAALENFEEQAEKGQGDMFGLQSHQAAEPEQVNKNSNPSTEKANLGVDEDGNAVGGPTSVAPLGASIAAQNLQDSHENQHAPESDKTDSTASFTDSSASGSSPSTPSLDNTVTTDSSASLSSSSSSSSSAQVSESAPSTPSEPAKETEAKGSVA